MSGKSFFTLKKAFVFVTCIVITVHIVENQNHAKADLEEPYHDASAAEQGEPPPQTRMWTRTRLPSDNDTDADTDTERYVNAEEAAENTVRTSNAGMAISDFADMDTGTDTDADADIMQTISFPSAELVPGNSENERIEAALLSKAQHIENCRITHYCTCKICCGWDIGITASGLPAIAYSTVAVDPRLIPLGSDVLIDFHDGNGLQYYKADDTGSAVNGSHIDICVSEHQEALQLGVKYATVYFIPPEQL